MDRNVTLIHKENGARLRASQYVEGEHPPPAGIKVTHGLRGVLARANTVQGELSVINNGDWLVTMPNGDRDIFTDTFVKGYYRREDEEATGPDAPVRLG